MVMVCIVQARERVRSAGAGDAGRIVKAARRDIRACLDDPKGPVFPTLDRRRPPLTMLPASPHDALLAQDPENRVQTVTISQTGS